MSDEVETSLSSPYEPSCTLSDEEKTIQGIWAEININNSWELLLLQAPYSIMALGKLMVLSLTASNRKSVSVVDGISLRDRRYEMDSGYLHTLLVQAVNEGRIAQEAAHQSMAIIKHDMNEIPQAIRDVLELLSQHSSQQIRFQLPIQVKRIRSIVEDSAREAGSLGPRFQKAMQLMSDRSGGIGRDGFSLLAEVKMFWSAVISFCEELGKLVQYTLDSSCNAFIATLHNQFEAASKQSKFSIKQKARNEIYQTSIAMIAYASSVRHLANAYIQYSSQFIMPQINAIARYPMLATNAIEFAKAQRQFNAYNNACERETNRIMGINGELNKRRSILELDMGLNLHISDIGADLGVFLQPIAEFRKGKLNRRNSKVKTMKEKQKEEKESENDGKVKMKEEERRKTKEELNKVKGEKKRAKEEENRIKEEKKRAKEEEEKRIKEEKKRIKEEEKKNAKNEKHYAKEENQQENGEKINSIRKKFWKRSPSPQPSKSLQSPLSSQPPQLEQYYPQPQPQTQSISPLSSPSEFSSSLSPLSIESSTFTRTWESRFDKYCQSPESQRSFPSQQSPQSPQSLQFPLSPLYVQRAPSTQHDTMQTIQIPQQYFRTPQDLQSASSKSMNSEQNDHSDAPQYSQPLTGEFKSQENKRNLQSTLPAKTPHHSGVNAPLHQFQQQQRQLHYPKPVESSTPLKNPQNSHYQQKAQLLRRGRPISYPSNFRQIEFSSLEHSGEYPHIHSEQLEGNVQNTQYPYFSRSSFNPAYPQSSTGRSIQPRPTSFGYPSTFNMVSSFDASSIPTTASPQSPQSKQHGGIFGKLRASFSSKSKKSVTNGNNKEEPTELSI
uniref:BRO1 domain-containing protein n=1 Tax=Parascaris univalens TaxID=6257 RepID=A0A914ZRZ4_PARUN